MTDIRGKRTLITGSAKGMGRRMAKRFGHAGAELLLVDIDEENLEQTAHELRDEGFPVETFVCDLAHRENVAELRDEVHDEVGRIDILVNNAAIVQGGSYTEIDPEWDQLMLDVNIGAVHWLTKAFLPDLEQGRDTHLVNMASAAGFFGVPQQIIYSASKWFVIGLSEGLRLELDQRDADQVSMTIVCPSLVDTGMFEGSDPPMFSPILDPEFVAGRVLEAVDGDELYVQEPFTIKVAPMLRALLPTEVTDVLMDAIGATSIMQGWEGRNEEA
jgi:short-subunit dehydrogenase